MTLDPGRDGSWCFAAAVDLIRAVDFKHSPSLRESGSCLSFSAAPLSPKSPPTERGRQLESDSNESLGNFDSIFSALGLPLKDPSVSSPSSEALALGPAVSTSVSAPVPSHRPKGNPHRVLPRPRGQSPKKVQGISHEGACITGSDSEVKLKASGSSPAHPLLVADDTRPINSESKQPRNDDSSQARRDVIHSIVGRSPKTPNKVGNAPLLTIPSLTPASVKPSKHAHTQSGEQIFAPRSYSSEKLIHLIDMLFQRFPKDNGSLSTLHNSSISSPPKFDRPGDESQCIHVFVDISNILIGFHDTLKLRRGLSKEHRIPRQPLSFQKLALILERGRKASKRELAGSDQLESTLEAKYIGYSTHILERVAKYKEPTSRQKYFRRLNGDIRNSSGSDDNSHPTNGIRRVEQGVDEILHLKMSHSLLDTETPSTMVLATGDAAEAEYSDGFLAMVERALERKWKVELVAFKGNLSRAYTNSDWTSRWGDAFKIIELDDFAELLHYE